MGGLAHRIVKLMVPLQVNVQVKVIHSILRVGVIIIQFCDNNYCFSMRSATLLNIDVVVYFGKNEKVSFVLCVFGRIMVD